MPHSNDIAKGFVRELPLFPDYVIPKGGLTNDRVTHALFYYYILAMQMYDQEQNGVVYEGDKDPEFLYSQVFRSVADLYDVSREAMAQAWASVDLTCAMHQMPKMPHGAKYRRGARH